MRSILENALVHLLNDEKEQAEALFHKFIVERARQIHESLRSDDDEIVDDFDDIVSDEMFTEEDFQDLEDGDDEFAVDGDENGDADLDDEAETVADDLGVDVDDAADDFDADADVDADADAEEFGGDFEDDGDVDADPEVEDRIADLEDQLEKLTQEFEELMAAEKGEADEADADADEEFADEGEIDPELSDHEATEIADTVEDDMDDEVRESEEDLEDFEGLAESALSDLEKVTVDNTDGKEVGKGKAITRNTKSAVPAKKPDPKDAKPVPVKGEKHTGFDREPAPPVKDMKKRRNTRSKATDGMKPVSKEGDKKALVNKPMR